MRKGLVEVQSLSLNMLARSQFESLFHPYIHPTHLCLFPSLRSLDKPVISSKLWLFLRSIAKGFFCFSYVHWIEDWGSRESREPLMANRAIPQTAAGDLWHQQPSDAYQTCSPLSNWLIYRRIACSCSSIRAFVGWCARCSRVQPSLEPPRGLRAIYHLRRQLPDQFDFQSVDPWCGWLITCRANGLKWWWWERRWVTCSRLKFGPSREMILESISASDHVQTFARYNDSCEKAARTNPKLLGNGNRQRYSTPFGWFE